MLEIMSFEVPAESVRTVAGAQSWRQRVPDFRDATEKLRAPNAVCANGMVSRMVIVLCTCVYIGRYTSMRKDLSDTANWATCWTL